jgi:hypothetical protein
MGDDIHVSKISTSRFGTSMVREFGRDGLGIRGPQQAEYDG